MPRIEIAEGRFYRGKSSFLRKVLMVSADRIRWHDRIGPGDCTISTFRSWLRDEVSDIGDPEIAQIEAAIGQVEQENARTLESMANLLEEIHTGSDITVWTTFDQLPPVMRKLYVDAKGRKTKLKWICWIPERKAIPAFCQDDGVSAHKVKGKGAFHVRLEGLAATEIVNTAFSGGRVMREEGDEPLTYAEFRKTFVGLGAADDQRLLKALFNVWVAGHNSTGSKRGDLPFLT